MYYIEAMESITEDAVLTWDGLLEQAHTWPQEDAIAFYEALELIPKQVEQYMINKSVKSPQLDSFTAAVEEAIIAAAKIGWKHMRDTHDCKLRPFIAAHFGFKLGASRLVMIEKYETPKSNRIGKSPHGAKGSIMHQESLHIRDLIEQLTKKADV